MLLGSEKELTEKFNLLDHKREGKKINSLFKMLIENQKELINECNNVAEDPAYLLQKCNCSANQK